MMKDEYWIHITWSFVFYVSNSAGRCVDVYNNTLWTCFHLLYLLWNAPNLSFVSLSMVVLNSRDWRKNIWLPKRMHLDKQLHKNENMKNLPQRYNYNSNNAISSFKQAKYSDICPLENFKISNEITFHLTVCLPVNKNSPRAYTADYIAFKLPEKSVISVSTKLC